MERELQLFNFKGTNFTVITIEDKSYWVAKEICEELDIKNHSDATNKLKDGSQKRKLSYEECKQIGLTDLENLQIGSKGIMLLTESGIFKLAFRSDKPSAEDFTDWISEEVLPSIRNKGKFDIVENKLQQIEDSKEREMSLSLYNLEQALKHNPNDMLMVLTYNNKKQELETYKQQIQLNQVTEEVKQLQETLNVVKENTEIIKNQQVYICNRTNFHERVNILANKYFGRDREEAYKQIYNKMKLLGSFDVFARRKYMWEHINIEREQQGKKPYAKSTLKQKCNFLDVIDKFDKWELCSEAYKTIESEFMN